VLKPSSLSSGPFGIALGYCVLAAVRDVAETAGFITTTSVLRVPSLARGFVELPPPVSFAEVAQRTDVLVLTSDGYFSDCASGAALVQQVAEATRRCCFEVHGSVPLIQCLYQVRPSIGRVRLPWIMRLVALNVRMHAMRAG